jgi:hypothetical protein
MKYAAGGLERLAARKAGAGSFATRRLKLAERILARI